MVSLFDVKKYQKMSKNNLISINVKKYQKIPQIYLACLVMKYVDTKKCRYEAQNYKSG